MGLLVKEKARLGFQQTNTGAGGGKWMSDD
jgi:hypothetical protein